MRKTDIEIAADAIKYCRTELLRLKRMILQAELGELLKQPNEDVVKSWHYQVEKLEYILGEREEMPKPYWRMN